MRVTDDKLDDFKIVGELRGLSMSAMVHQFIVQAIWEEKKKHPEAFAESENGQTTAVIIEREQAPEDPDHNIHYQTRRSPFEVLTAESHPELIGMEVEII